MFQARTIEHAWCVACQWACLSISIPHQHAHMVMPTFVCRAREAVQQQAGRADVHWRAAVGPRMAQQWIHLSRRLLHTHCLPFLGVHCLACLTLPFMSDTVITWQSHALYRVVSKPTRRVGYLMNWPQSALLLHA